MTSPARSRRGAQWQRQAAGAALTLPALLMVGLFILGPLVYSVMAGFSNYRLTAPGWSWIGLDNYVELVVGEGGRPGTFRPALRNALVFAGLSVALELLLGFGLALLLNRRLRLSGMWRILLVLPIMIAPTVSALQWRWILDPDFGVLNWVGLRLGLLETPQLWLLRPHTALLTVVLVDVWQTTPFVMLFLLAGLQSLPAEPVEAAKVDGASGLQIFRYVTLPLLQPIVVTVLLLRFMDAIRIFDIVYILTQGGPAFATDMVSLYTYRAGLQWFEIGKASAAATITLLVIALCAWAVLAITRTRAGQGEA